MIVEGTLVTENDILAAENDYLWIRLNLSCGFVEFYGHICADASLSKGEYRFRTIARQFAESESQSVKNAEGISIQKTQFEVLPLVSSPRDLYSLAILAIRIFIVDKTLSLPVALDEILGLANALANSFDESSKIAERIEKIFSNDGRWEKSLGPQHLTYDDLNANSGFNNIPAPLWFETLATIIQMLPECGPDSECKNFGDAPDGAIHRVFDCASENIQNLIRRSRSLIIPDWDLNNEIIQVIQNHSIS